MDRKRRAARSEQVSVRLTSDVPAAPFEVPADKVAAYLKTKRGLTATGLVVRLVAGESEVAALDTALLQLLFGVSDVAVLPRESGVPTRVVSVYGSSEAVAQTATYIAHAFAVVNNRWLPQLLTLKLANYRLTVILASSELPPPPPLVHTYVGPFEATEATAVDIVGDLLGVFSYISACRLDDVPVECTQIPLFGVHVDAGLYQRTADTQAKLHDSREVLMLVLRSK